MNRQRALGATAATMLPAALSAAVLVSAPFAGTTTAPLADTHPAAAPGSVHPAVARPAATQPAPTQPAAQPAPTGAGLRLSIPTGDIAVLVGFEICLLGVGAGVIVTAVRRRDRARDN